MQPTSPVPSTSDIARMERRLRAQDLFRRAWHDVSVATARNQALDDVLAVVLDYAGRLLGTRNCYVSLVDTATGALRERLSTGVLKPLRDSDTELQRGMGTAGRVWASGAAEIVNDLRAWAERAPAARGQMFSAEIAVPIRQDSAVIGVLGALYVEAVREFDADDASDLEQFAGLAASAVYNASLVQQLRQTQEMVAQLLDRMGEGLASTTVDSRIGMVNRRLGELSGAAPDTLVGVPAQELFPDYYDALAYGYGSFVAEQPADSFRTYLRRRDTQALSPIILSGTPRFEDGGLGGSLLVVTDLSEQQALESRIDQARVEARKEVEREQVFRRQFVAVASHELRTPLNAVLGLSDLLQQSDLGEDERAYAQSIYEAGESMLQIVNNILDYARLEDGRLALAMAPFRVADALAKVRQLFVPMLKARRDLLRLDVAPDVPELLVGDEARVRQVLANLISNAIKHTEDGAIVVTFTRRAASGGSVDLEVSVRDTGEGMSAERVASLFSPFGAVAGEAADALGSSGLGLVISQRLVAMMGGRIEVESEPGAGSTFRFNLTLGRAP